MNSEPELDQADAAKNASSDVLGNAHDAPPVLVSVAGENIVGCTLFQFERRCLILIGEEQRALAPNNVLIDVLCNAVRLARAHRWAMLNLGEIKDG